MTAVVLVAGGATWATQESRQRDLASLDARIHELEDVRKDEAAAVVARADEDASSALGYSASRLAEDRATVGAMLSTAFEWDSAESYERAREQLVERYGIPAQDAFLTEFLPPALHVADADGQRRYFLDERGLTSSLGTEPRLAVVRVVGTSYQYVVMTSVDLRAVPMKDAKGSNAPAPTVTRPVLLHVTVEADGSISELAGASGRAAPANS